MLKHQDYIFTRLYYLYYHKLNKKRLCFVQFQFPYLVAYFHSGSFAGAGISCPQRARGPHR